MTGPELTALFFGVNGIVVGIGTVVVALIGSKKDRVNATLTATEKATEAANEVRKELHAELQQYRADNRELRNKGETERAQYELDRRDWQAALHTMEKQALESRAEAKLSELRAKTAEDWAVELRRQVVSLEARVSELLGQKAA